jgi:hypothetical protein
LSSSEPPDPAVFFTDRDLGKQFPGILAKAGIEVRRHADHFPPDCPDEKWLAYVGSQGWVAVTHDTRIRYKPNEKKAVIDNNVRLLVVVGRAALPTLADNFAATITEIEAFVAAHPPPWIAKVYRPSPNEGSGGAGSVSMWLEPA